MKKKPTLFGIAFAMSALFSAKAQTDLTSLITNPSFETGDLTGWTWTGATGYGWLGPNTDGDATKNGTYVCGVWNGSIADPVCSQTLTGLASGFYKVTALVTVSKGRLTNQRLFANSGPTTKSMLYGAGTNAAYSAANLAILSASETYSFGGYSESTAESGPFKRLSVVKQVTDGTLTLGIKVSGKASTQGYVFSNTTSGDAGFFKFDGFTLTEVSNEANLDNIMLSAGLLDAPFSPNTTTYTATLPVGTTTVTPTPVVSVEGEVISGADAVNVSSGSGSSTITVTSLDGTTTKTYTIDYTVLTLSNDATLSTLTLNAGTLVPDFSPTTTSYIVEYNSDVTSVTPTVVVNEAHATISGEGVVTITNGVATSTIVVTAQDGTTKKTYTINYYASFTPLYTTLTNLIGDPYCNTLYNFSNSWGANNRSVETDYVYCGARSIKVSGKCGSSLDYDLTGKIEAGKTYHVKAMVSTNGTGETKIGISGVDTAPLVYTISTASGEWLPLEFTFTASLSVTPTTSVNLFLNSCESQTATESYIDNYEMYDVTSIQTSVNSQIAVQSQHIYAQGNKFIAELKLSKTAKVQFLVYNVQGELLTQTDAKMLQVGHVTETIDAPLSQGVYLVKTIIDGKFNVTKIIK